MTLFFLKPRKDELETDEVERRAAKARDLAAIELNAQFEHLFSVMEDTLRVFTEQPTEVDIPRVRKKRNGQ